MFSACISALIYLPLEEVINPDQVRKLKDEVRPVLFSMAICHLFQIRHLIFLTPLMGGVGPPVHQSRCPVEERTAIAS